MRDGHGEGIAENSTGAAGATGAAARPVPRSHMRRPRWTATMLDMFFAHLAGSCDVAASAEAVGLTAAHVRHPLRTDPAFAAQWEGAIRAGYQLLETRLIGRLLAGDDAPADVLARIPSLDPVGWERAIKLLTLDKARRTARGDARAAAPEAAGRDETDRMILSKLAALAAGRAKRVGSIDEGRT